MRKQKKSHWDEFLADNTNIWNAAKYLIPEKTSGFDKVPPLTRLDGSSTTSTPEQAEELLKTLFHRYPTQAKTRVYVPNGHHYLCHGLRYKK